MKIFFWKSKTETELKKKIADLENENYRLKKYQKLLKESDSRAIFCEHCKYALKSSNSIWLPSDGFVVKTIYACELSKKCENFEKNITF